MRQRRGRRARNRCERRRASGAGREPVTALDLNDICVVGNDTGGTVVQLLAVDHPARLSSVVITDCDAFENLPPTLFKYLCWLARLPPAFGLAMRSMSIRPLQRSPLAFGWLTKHGVPRPVAEHYVSLFRRSGATRADLIRFLRGVNNRPTLRIAGQFQHVALPTLVAWSKDDRVFPYEHAQRLSALIAEAGLVTCEDSYAYLPFDQTSWLAGQIKQFATANVIKQANKH